MTANQRRKQRAAVKAKSHIAGFTAERETAEELGVSVRTLRKWRQTGEGPPFVQVGRRILYRDEARAQWLIAREVRPIRPAAA